MLCFMLSCFLEWFTLILVFQNFQIRPNNRNVLNKMCTALYRICWWLPIFLKYGIAIIHICILFMYFGTGLKVCCLVCYCILLHNFVGLITHWPPIVMCPILLSEGGRTSCQLSWWRFFSSVTWLQKFFHLHYWTELVKYCIRNICSCVLSPLCVQWRICVFRCMCQGLNRIWNNPDSFSIGNTLKKTVSIQLIMKKSFLSIPNVHVE